MKNAIIILFLFNCVLLSSQEFTDYFYPLDCNFLSAKYLDENKIVFTGTNGRVVFSMDKGNTFFSNYTSTQNNLFDVDEEPNSKSIFCVGNNSTMIRTNNYGNTWKKLTNSSQSNSFYPILNLKRSNNEYYLLSDLSLFKMKKDSLEQLMNIKEEVEATELEAPPVWLYEPYPNPSNKNVSLDMIWDKRYNGEDIEISIYNIYGSKIKDIKNINKSYLLDNKVNISFEIDDLPSGIYQICASIKNYKRFVSFVVSR